MAIDTEIKTFLNGILSITGGKQKEYYQFLVDNIKSTPTTLVRKIPNLEKQMSVSEINAKECYNNSQKIVLYNRDLGIEYVEGYYIIEGIGLPIEHAWNKIGDYYFDLTAQLVWDSFEPNNYFAIHSFDYEQIAKFVFKKEKFSYVFDTPLKWFYHKKLI